MNPRQVATRWLTGIALALMAHAGNAADDDASRLARLFPRQAEIFVEGSGLARLVLPAEILAELRPDLSDLRVFDADGRELAFVVEPGPPAGNAPPREVRRPARVISVEREIEQVEDELPIVRERYVLAAPEVAAVGAAEIELLLAPSAARFVRTVRVSRAGDGPGRELVSGAPLFRLPESAERTRIGLTAPDAEVTVAIEGREDFYLEPEFFWVEVPALPRAPQAEVALVLLSRESTRGMTTLELARPPGLVPAALRFATSTSSFVRAVEVVDVRAGGVEVPTGGGTILRAALAVPVEALEVPMRSAALGDRLRVTVDDRDSPPLDSIVVSAVVVQPSLLIPLTAPPGGGAAGMLRFGGGRATRPRHDLADLRDVLEQSAEHRAALERAPGSDLATAHARLGPLAANPDFDTTPALAFAMRAGSVLDSRVFEFRRSLRAPDTGQGSVRVVLDALDASHLRDDHTDVRVVDAENRQWPYLLEPDATRTWLELEVRGPTRTGARSEYELVPPQAPLRMDRVELLPDTGLVQRPFTLTGRDRDGAETLLEKGVLSLHEAEPRPLEIEISPQPLAALVLALDDGDEAPLVLSRVRARVLLPELVLVAPAGEYALLLGWPESEPPQYALAAIRDVVLAVASEHAELGPSAANPDFSASARLTTRPGADSTLRSAAVWGVLLVAVALLVVLTLRMARADGPAGQGPTSGDSAAQ